MKVVVVSSMLMMMRVYFKFINRSGSWERERESE